MGLGGVARRILPKSWFDALIFRRAERLIARSATAADEAEVGSGPPLPPGSLRVLVVGDGDGPAFLRRGREQAEFIIGLGRPHGLSLDRPVDMLDFGCGCGRLARWIAPQVEAAGGRFTGSDLNPALVRWCAGNLPGRYLRNGLTPPLRIETASQDAIYAYSVVTHLTLSTTRAWLGELARVLRPGGLAMVSFHDEDFRPGEHTEALLRDGYLVSTRMLEGSNHMASYATRAFFSGLCDADFEVLEIRPSETANQMQAWAVLRRKAA